MTRLTKRYRFAASHRLHHPELSDEANRELYGKCDNPFGHGHDYMLEVSVAGEVDPRSGQLVPVSELDALVRETVLADYDHRDMNSEIPAFATLVPTTENVAADILKRLSGRWPEAFPAGPGLERIRLFETRKNIIELRVES